MTKNDFSADAFVMFNPKDGVYGVQMHDLAWRTEDARAFAAHIIAECDRADALTREDLYRRLDGEIK